MRLFIILLFSSVFHSQFALAEKLYQGWQGEWGSWQKNSKGSYEGQSISIYECGDDNIVIWGPQYNPLQHCKIRVPGDTGKYYIEGELQFISSNKADVYSDSEPTDGKVHLTLENTPKSHRIILQQDADSSWPKKLSASYNFRTDHHYPDVINSIGGIPFYKISCFADSDPGIQFWCNSPEISNFEAKLIQLALDAEQDEFGASCRLDEWRENMLKNCRYQKDFLGCYKNQFAKFEAESQKTMTDRADRYAKLQKPGDPNTASSLIDKIDGVYKTSHIYHPMDGGKPERLENILEIVKTSANSIYFRLDTDYGNAHGCNMYGIAHYTDDGSFIYNDMAEKWNINTCLLKITPSIKGIRINEVSDNQACHNAYCSVIEGTPDELFNADRRRPIRYMERLKNSEEYKTAVSGKIKLLGKNQW